jgi:PKD repeat protein
MKRIITLCYLITSGLSLLAGSITGNKPVLLFKENKNQWDGQVLYAAELQNGSVFLSNNSFTFQLSDTADLSRIRRSHISKAPCRMDVHVHVFRQIFDGAADACAVTTTDKANEYFNFYLGKDPSRWAGHVNAFHEVDYHNLYPHIDLEVSSENVNMKYTMIVNPGGDPAVIGMRYAGINGISINDGNLNLQTSIGTVSDMRPYAYQLINDQERMVNCQYEIKNGKVGFVFPDGYDVSRQLVIDPMLVFSTYSGSTADNFGYCATYDNQGNTYTAGTVFGNIGRYPLTTGAFQTTWGGGTGFYADSAQLDGDGVDIAITKYDTVGHTRIYSTYLGGKRDEMPHSIVVNDDDELFVYGTTASSDFPVTANAYDTTFKSGTAIPIIIGVGVSYVHGSDIFISRFSADGTDLLASTYIGGSGNDGLTYPQLAGLNYNYGDDVRGEINIDHHNHIYVGSSTYSSDFPVTAGAYQTVKRDSSDGVIFKMDDGLSRLLWSTYLGGSGADAIYSMDLDPQGNILVAGGTQSTDFPIPAASYQNTLRGSRAEGFAVRLSSDGRTMQHGTFFGKDTAYNQVYFIRSDKAGNAYLYGQTEAKDSSYIYHAAYSHAGSGQFISKLNPTLDTLIWSTAFGSGRGIPDISPTALMVDACDRIYITGWGADYHRLYGLSAPALSTAGLDVTPGALQAVTDSEDFYIMVMESDASALSYASFIGSPNNQEHIDGGASRFDKRGVIYQAVCAGCGGLSTFPVTTNAVSTTNNSPNCSNAVFKLDMNMPILSAAFASPAPGCAPYTAHFSNTSRAVLSPSYFWDFGDGGFDISANPSHQYTRAGIYIVRLITTDPGACNGSDTAIHRVLVMGNTVPDTLPAISPCRAPNQQIGISPFADTSIHYAWYPTAGLSQSNVANPFCTDSVYVAYHLTVYNASCADTFVQIINCPRVANGLSTVSEQNTFDVYPDPVRDDLMVRQGHPADVLIEVYDIYGQSVMPPFRTAERESTIHMINMATGIYFVRLTDSTGHYDVRKVMKL